MTNELIVRHMEQEARLKACIAELETQLAAVPKWTRITGDPNDSPPENSGWVLSFNGSGCALTPTSTIRNYPGMFTHWMRITPPQVES